MVKRLGVFGGTFDPVHFGHLLLAESCREQLRLDRVLLIPAAQSPHKPEGPRVDGGHRTTMIELAIGSGSALQVSRLELDRPGPSFTVDTLTALSGQYPGAALFLLLGADSLADLPNWRAAARICELAIPVAVDRPDADPPSWDRLATVVSEARLAQMRAARVRSPQIQLSSREIRSRVATGQSIRYRTPGAVIDYIATHQLYQE